ncbi:MAG: hypothetical protein AB7T07_08595 [Steroidobacteraceae bacterium]
MRRNFYVLTSTLLLGLLGSALSSAEESTMKEGAKKIGQETGEVVHKIGEGGKEVGKKVAETAREVGHATRDGAKEFAKAVKGQSSSNTHSSTSSAPVHQHKSNSP